MITGGFLVQRPAVAAVVPIGKRYDSAHGSVNFYLFFFFVNSLQWTLFVIRTGVELVDSFRRKRTLASTARRFRLIPVRRGEDYSAPSIFFFVGNTPRNKGMRERERPPHQDEGASCVFRWFSLEKNNGKNPTAMTRQKLMEITFNKIFHSSSFFSFFLYLLT